MTSSLCVNIFHYMLNGLLKCRRVSLYAHSVYNSANNVLIRISNTHDNADIVIVIIQMITVSVSTEQDGTGTGRNNYM